MRITSVRVHLVTTDNRLRGIATVIIDDSFALHELRILEGKDGLFVAMPSRKLKDGTFKDIVHPINVETRQLLEDEILKQYHNVVEKEAIE